MDWIEDIGLLENITSVNNNNNNNSEWEVPIFKPNNNEWSNFDSYLNKISKFIYTVGIGKLLPPNLDLYCRFENIKSNGKHFITDIINNTDNEIYLLDTYPCNDIEFKEKLDCLLKKNTNKNINENNIWDNILNFSIFYTVFNYNLQNNYGNSNVDDDDIIITITHDKNENLYNFILNNKNISSLQDNFHMKILECSIGSFKNWEILPQNTFKIYYLHGNKNIENNNNNNNNNNKNIRIWYSILENDVAKFYNTLKSTLNSKFNLVPNKMEKFLSCPNFLNHLHLLINPKWLIDHHIKFTKIIQYTNEMIVLFPSSCTFALDLTEGNEISEIQFVFKINYNRPTISQKCSCSENTNNSTIGNTKSLTSTVPAMIALNNSSTNIPRTTLHRSLSTNDFNESISRISSPLFSRLLNTGNTTTTTLSSGDTNYEDNLNLNEKENHGDAFLLPSIESVMNINDRIHYDNQSNLDLNYDKNNFLKNFPLNSSNPSDIITNDLQQKQNHKNNSLPCSTSSGRVNKITTSPSHLPLPPLITPIQLDNYKLVTSNPTTLTGSNSHMLTNTSDNNNININNKGNTIDINHTSYFSNPGQICLGTSTTGNDIMRRIASPSFLPLNISRGITESPLSLSITAPLSNDNFGRGNVNVGYCTLTKPNKLINSSLLVNNEQNYFTNNGNLTNSYSLLDNGSLHNDDMELMETFQKSNVNGKKRDFTNKVSKKKEKRYTTSDYNNLLYNRFHEEQGQFNQDNSNFDVSLVNKKTGHFNLEQNQHDIGNSQTNFTPHQSQTRFLPNEVLLTDSGKIYICCECKRQFSSGHHLTRHKKSVHSGEKPHSCPKCGKKFKRRDHVLQHLNKKIPCK